ncbi:MAG: methyl-accepting chemotaxis protein [Desulforhopalus sp.]|nr:methyl-accepting chemotaxis protein [Desulforhopalus sp.]
MDGKTESLGIVQSSASSQFTGRQKIRGRLLWAFMSLIALTFVIITIALISQTHTQKKLVEVVEVQSKIARLALATENTLRVMQRYEKDFLLNYEGKGVRDAKELYLNRFVILGGEAASNLFQIQQLVKTQQQVETAQKATDAINAYKTAFVATANTLELRYEKEQGEFAKLRKSLESIGSMVVALNYSPLQHSYYNFSTAVRDFLIVPEGEFVAAVQEGRTAIGHLVETLAINAQAKAKLSEQLGEFDKLFLEIGNTSAAIAAQLVATQEEVKKVEPAIRYFVDAVVINEAGAVDDAEKTFSMALPAVLVVALISILLALYMAKRLSRGLTDQMAHIVEIIEEIDKGNFAARTDLVNDDELGLMANKLNGMLDNITVLIQSQEERETIQESIMKLLEDISALTDGDFTGRAEVTEDMTGAIADSFNAMADQFSDIISKVKVATESVDTTSEQVAQQTMTLAQKNMQQVKGVTGAVEAIESMAQSIREVAANAQRSAAVSRQSRVNAQEGAQAVTETTKAMAELREQINETARSIKRLGESSLEIGNIVQIIDDIADRTSILALNASIQAAMAGEAGHGFAVVADEVQRLADSSSNSTKQIEVLVKSIQNEIKEVSNRIDEGISKVVQGSKLADGAHAKLQEIEKVSNDLAELVEAITAATTDQVRASETISQTMKEVGEISRESSLSSQDTATSMNVLNRTARDLRSAVEIFNVG